jgi:hypothetical protein
LAGAATVFITLILLLVIFTPQWPTGLEWRRPRRRDRAVCEPPMRQLRLMAQPPYGGVRISTRSVLVEPGHIHG